MKRTFTYLLLLVLLVCGKQAYNLLISNESIRSNPTGALSDIADEVIAIPLQDSGTHSIKEAKYIRQEGDNLFLISNETLYRFNRKGEFICRITHPDDIRVAGYVVNPANQQLIVLGNTDDIFYYSFNGDLLTRKKLKCDLPENRHMLSISMHNNRIFTTEECVHGDTAGQTATIEKQIVEYDSSFHKLQYDPSGRSGTFRMPDRLSRPGSSRGARKRNGLCLRPLLSTRELITGHFIY